MSELKEAIRPYGIAVDYDDTFTTCPETWTKVIETLRAAGARVFCVTSRMPDVPVKDFPGEIFYASGRGKAEFMHEQGVDVHIWIDDQPQYIGWNPEKLAIAEAMGLKRKVA